jgi:8-oxo-dGTP pyrophosphatase MutT (NUDIX family)
MHRRRILRLLERHVPVDERERRALREVLEFVRQETACFERTCDSGHVTGSAWIVSRALDAVVLLHHAKLDRWLQPGGHADGDAAVARVAYREAREETGLRSLQLASDDVFDVDVHEIPERPGEPRHLHYDVRFLFFGDRSEVPSAGNESHAVAWLELSDAEAITRDPSVRRMIMRTRRGDLPERTTSEAGANRRRA